MQPCSVCGGSGVDANGYCVNCRTYRRLPEREFPAISGPGWAGPTSNHVPYPQHAPLARHTGEMPYLSGEPPYEITDDYARPPSRRTWRIVVPATVALAVLAAAFFVFRDGDSEKESLVDRCVVGSWTVTSMTMDVTTAAFGDVHFRSSGTIGAMSYAADGTAINTYSDNAQLVADVTVSGVQRKAVLKITGLARYDYRTANSTMSFSNLRSERKTTLSITGTSTQVPMEVEITDKPARYSCLTDTLTVFTENYRAEAHRDS